MARKEESPNIAGLSIDQLISLSNEDDQEGKRINEAIQALKKTGENLRAKRTQWEAYLAETRKMIVEGTMTIQDPATDYLIVNMPFQPANFAEQLGTKKAKLASFLQAIKTNKKYWQKTVEWKGWNHIDTYQILFLQDPVIELTPKQINLNAERIVNVSLEKIFIDDQDRAVIWPFVEIRGQEVMALDNNREYSAESSDFKNLLDSIRDYPSHVYSELLKATGREIPQEIVIKAQETIHQIATRAVKQLEKAFDGVKKADEKIAEIEGRINTDKKRTECYATRPVILPLEYDRVLAALDSDPFIRDERRALVGLKDVLQNMKRTGILEYKFPIETKVREGKSTIYNIPEFAGNIMSVLGERLSSVQSASCR